MSSTFVFFCSCLLFTAFATILPKKDTPTDVVVHATNKTSVPSVVYLVDAVECLKEAYSIYDNDVDRAQVYAELFQAKHNESKWSVVAGYTAAFINSEWYVETTVTGGKSKSVKKDKEDDKNSYYMIFSSS